MKRYKDSAILKHYVAP